MSANVVVEQKGGIGFLGLLTIVFIILKLTGVIAWSWWAVTSPLWAPFAIVIGFFVLSFLFVLMFSTYKEAMANRRRKKREQR